MMLACLDASELGRALPTCVGLALVGPVLQAQLLPGVAVPVHLGGNGPHDVCLQPRHCVSCATNM